MGVEVASTMPAVTSDSVTDLFTPTPGGVMNEM